MKGKGKRMSGTVQRIDTSGMDDAITALDKAVTEFADIRNSLESQTETLLGDWTGQAGDEFEKAFDTLKLYMSHEYDLLEVMRDDLKNIKQSYVDWDAEVGNGLITQS